MAAIRETIIQKLSELLLNEKKAKNVERSIYNWSIQSLKNNLLHHVNDKKYNNDLTWDNLRFRNMYTGKCRSILFNLRNPTNPSFLQKVLNGEVPTQTIANLSPKEIFPDLWEPILQKKLEKEMKALKNQGLMLEQAVEGSRSCSKCKCRKIHYYELQTRSADEPMTIYYTCLQCSNRWKE
jgi:transcription elongation factor S-II